MVLLAKGTPRDLLGCDQPELGHLGPDCLERPPRLGFDLLPRVLQPALPVGLSLVLDASQLRLGLVLRDRANLLRLAARLADQLAMLLKQLARFVPGLVRLVQRAPDALAALVDQLLNRTEGVPLQDEERDQEADDRPDHQPGRDLDQRVRAEQHQTRTYARIEPSRP